MARRLESLRTLPERRPVPQEAPRRVFRPEVRTGAVERRDEQRLAEVIARLERNAASETRRHERRDADWKMPRLPENQQRIAAIKEEKEAQRISDRAREDEYAAWGTAGALGLYALPLLLGLATSTSIGAIATTWLFYTGLVYASRIASRGIGKLANLFRNRSKKA